MLVVRLVEEDVFPVTTLRQALHHLVGCSVAGETQKSEDGANAGLYQRCEVLQAPVLGYTMLLTKLQLGGETKLSLGGSLLLPGASCSKCLKLHFSHLAPEFAAYLVSTLPYL